MNNAIGLGIILSLQDRASAGLVSIRNRMTALRDVSQDMMKQFDAGAKQLVAGLALMGTGAKVLGFLRSTFGASITTAADFEQAMAGVKAVSGATGETFEALSNQAKQMGRDTVFTSMQAAHAQENLIRAGLTTQEVLKSLPSVLNMASAEGMDLAEGARIMSETLTRFELDADQANRISNVFAEASRSTSLSIASLSNAMSYAGTTGHTLGMSLEEVSAWLGVLSNAGFRDSRGGTGFRGVFTRLADPKYLKKLQEFGVSVNDAAGNILSPRDLLIAINERTKSMSNSEVVSAMKSVFGQINYEAAIALSKGAANNSAKGFDALLAKFNDVGEAAKEMSDTMVNTLPGAMKRLESASEGLRIAIGNHLVPIYTKAIDILARFKSWLAQLIDAHPIISKAVIGLTTSLVAISGTALILVGALASIGGFIKMWPMLRAVVTLALTSIRAQAHSAMLSLSGLSLPVISMIALAAALYFAWRKNLWGLRDMVEAITQGFNMAVRASVDGIAEVDDELAEKLKAAGIWDYAVTMGQVFFRVRKLWEGFVEGFEESITGIGEVFTWIIGVFTPAIKGGQQLLKFLGLLKPVANSQTNTWKNWGRLLGYIAPIVLGIIGAFKAASIITGIIHAITGAMTLLNAICLTNPYVAAAAAIIAVAVALYYYWDDIKIWGGGAADYCLERWASFQKWWDGFSLSDSVSGIFERHLQRITDFFDSFTKIWDAITNLKFDSWENFWASFADIGTAYVDMVANFWAVVFSPFIEFYDWLVEDLEFPDVFGMLGDSVSSLWDWCKQGFNELINWLFEVDWSGVWDGILDAAETCCMWLTAPYTMFWGWLLGMDWQDVWQGVKDAAIECCEWLINPFGKFWELLSSFDWSNVWQGIKDAAVECCEWIKAPFVAFADWIMDKIGKLNPFNWELPSWLQWGSGGAAATPAQAEAGKAETLRKNGTLDFRPSYMQGNNVTAQSGMISSQPPEIPKASTFNLLSSEASQQLYPTAPKHPSPYETPEFEKGIEDLARFGIKLEIPSQPVQPQAQSSPLLIQHSQNQATMAGQATVHAQAQAPNNPVNVNNNVDVKIESKPVEIMLDGEKVGSAALRWVERQNIRNGAGES